MVTVLYGPYEPDKNSANASVLPVVNNLVPRSDGWGPLPAIIPTPPIYAYLTDPETGSRLTNEDGRRLVVGLDFSGIPGFIKLPAACTGYFAARKRDGTEVQFAGTATALYKFNRSNFTWEDVSSTTYASVVRWSFYRWGDKVYCQNGFDPEQKFDIESDTVFSDNTGAPICKYAVVVGNFVFRFNIVSWAAEPTFEGPLAFMCSALEDPEDNVLQDQNWCDAQFIPLGDEIIGAVPITGGAHIWLRGGVVPMQITMNDSKTFILGDVDLSRGCSAPYSLCSFGQDRYIVYADDGFWRYDGGFTPIGQDRVNRTFLATCDQDTFEEILAMNDPENAIIWAAYTNNDGQRRMLGYHYNLDRFTHSDVAVSASFVCRTFVYDGSDPPILKANQPRFSIIDEDGRLGYLVGDALSAQIVTNQLQFNIDRSFANKAQLNGDATNFLLTLITRDKKGGLPRERAPAQPSERSGNVPFRANGKTHVIELDIPAGEEWSYVAGLEVAAKRVSGS